LALKHEWVFAATDQGRGSFVIAVCAICGVIHTSWVPAGQR